ncbi:MAG: sigma-70 family RNA polymerase sigma factor [Polyangiaceae bacterium]|nr:sigma-70 family RNA polymerase sigma factor [Polyangiaceae bacterium]
MTATRERIQEVVREHHGTVLARLIRRLKSFDLAEDALQDALAAAISQWPRDGIPDSPRAWLFTAARNKAVDEIRKRTLHGEKHAELLEELETVVEDEPQIRDDMLRLMFTCCHPALALHAQVALTLSTVAGLEVEEIARAFLVPVPTLAQRLVRAKHKIRAANIPYAVPEASELSPRIEGISKVVYLTFNEGYTASRGDGIRAELCQHALRLGRELCRLLPEDGNALGLLALMELTDARRAARVDAEGELVLLEDQDRTLWNREQIDEGCALTRAALRRAPRGAYPLQAAISAVHAEAERATDTDWPQIAALYARLFAVEPTPVVALNRAVAVAMAHGPQTGLALLGELEASLSEYHLFHAARADLLRRAGQREAAHAGYGRALELCENAAEQRLLRKKLALVSP